MSFIGFLFNTSRHNHQFIAVFIEAQTKEVSVNSTQMKNLCWENPHKSKLWRNSDCESEDRAKVTLIYSILEMAGEEVIQVKMRDPLRGTHKFFLLSEPVLSTQYTPGSISAVVRWNSVHRQLPVLSLSLFFYFLTYTLSLVRDLEWINPTDYTPFVRSCRGTCYGSSAAYLTSCSGGKFRTDPRRQQRPTKQIFVFES